MAKSFASGAVAGNAIRRTDIARKNSTDGSATPSARRWPIVLAFDNIARHSPAFQASSIEMTPWRSSRFILGKSEDRSHAVVSAKRCAEDVCRQISGHQSRDEARYHRSRGCPKRADAVSSSDGNRAVANRSAGSQAIIHPLLANKSTIIQTVTTAGAQLAQRRSVERIRRGGRRFAASARAIRGRTATAANNAIPATPESHAPRRSARRPSAENGPNQSSDPTCASHRWPGSVLGSSSTSDAPSTAMIAATASSRFPLVWLP